MRVCLCVYRESARKCEREVYIYRGRDTFFAIRGGAVPGWGGGWDDCILVVCVCVRVCVYVCVFTCVCVRCVCEGRIEEEEGGEEEEEREWVKKAKKHYIIWVICKQRRKRSNTKFDTHIISITKKVFALVYR